MVYINVRNGTLIQSGLVSLLLKSRVGSLFGLIEATIKIKFKMNHTSFRYKLCILLSLGVIIFLLVIQYLLHGSRNGDEQSSLKSYLVEPLDILYVEDNLMSLEQSDPQLIQYARVRHLSPPSKLEYNLETKSGNFRDAFSGWVADFFENKRDGIFIEAGAHEGEKGSHTLYLERELGWKGLLVECNPTVIPYLKSKHRKAWIADVCLSPTSYSGTLNFSNPTNWTYSGTLRQPWNLPVPTKWTFFDVQSLPFYTILAALGWKEIDYFSFDIEGQELSVLKHFPFDQVIFRVFVIEVQFYTEQEKQELNSLLVSKGYIFVKNMQVDKVYVHESVQHLIKTTTSS